MTTHSQKTFRLRGIPEDFRDAKSVRGLVRSTLGLPDVDKVKVRSVARSPYDSRKRIATLDFSELPPALSDESKSEWEFEMRHGTSEDDDDENLYPDTLTFDTHFVGITPLRRADDADYSIDCVALSGLNGHAFGSFKKKAGLFMWLRDGLPIDIPSARILIYGYDTKLVNSASFQNLQDLGRSLFMTIQDIRTNATGLTSTRPLVLIGHSLGGLVIKEGIISLDQSDEADKATLHSIRSILFFGVPHDGMAIESLVPLVRGKPNEALLHTLDKNSVILKRHRNEFPKVLGKNPPEIISFYETMKSPTAQKSAGKWRMDGPLATLVDTSSATSGCKKQYPINRDHSDMVKLLGLDDGPYRTVVRHFRSLINGSGPTPGSAVQGMETKATKRTYEEFNEQEQPQSAVTKEIISLGCLQSLAFPEQDFRMTEISVEKNTCDWLLQDLHYKEWTGASRGMVWIKGKPGAGKSTIMKYAYEESRRHSRSTSNLVFGYCIHGRGTLLQKTTLGIFRALLNQMLHESIFEPYLQELADIYRDREERMGSYAQQRWFWTEADLRTFMASVFPRAAKIRPITLYIDALDELGEEAATRFVDYLESLLADVELSGASAKICFSCRNYPIIRLDYGSTIHVDRHNFTDVSLLVRERLSKASLDPVVTARLENEIAKGAQGVFQWAILVVRRAIELSRRGTKAETIMKAIRETPTELDDLYAELLGNICENERPSTLKLFQWVCLAARPLELDEMRYAMAADAKMSYATERQLEESEGFRENAQDTIATINHLSRGLIETTTLPKQEWQPEYIITSHSVQFIHQSVAEYILRSRFLMLEGGHSRSSLTGWGHYEISRSCLKFIAMGIRAGNIARTSFSRYAVSYIPWHLRRVEDEGIAQKDLPTLMAWMNLSGTFATLERHGTSSSFALKGGYEINSGSKLWHAIAAWGILSAFDALDLMEDPYTTSEDANGHTPFKLSIMHGHEAVALKLFQFFSAKINVAECDSVLQQAVKKGMRQLVPRLLQHGANANSRVEKSTVPPLALAVQNQDADTSQILLEAGADTDILCEEDEAETAANADIAGEIKAEAVHADISMPYTTRDTTKRRFCTPILLYSIQKRNLEIFSQLLQWNANIRRGNPLHEAISLYDPGNIRVPPGSVTLEPDPSKHQERDVEKTSTNMITMLLAKGADVHEPRSSNFLPLTIAVRSNRISTVQLLLEHGAQPEREDFRGWTAMHHAASRGRVNIVRVLLAAGASPHPMEHEIKTPIIHATMNGHYETVKVLLEAIKAKADSSGTRLPQGLSNHTNELSQLIPQLLYTLCARYERSLPTGDDRKLCPLSQAARDGDKAAVRLLLLLDSSHKDFIKEDRRNSRAPLSYAAQSGHDDIASLLLPKSNVEEADSTGRTPLMYAIESRRLGTMELLLTAGNANPNKRLGGSAIMVFTKAVWDGDEELIRVLLNSPILDVDPREEDGYSHTSSFFRNLPRDKAVANRFVKGFVEMVKQLTGFSLTPILFAAAYERTIIAEMLLKTGKISTDSLNEAYAVAEAYSNVELMGLIQGARGRSST